MLVLDRIITWSICIVSIFLLSSCNKKSTLQTYREFLLDTTVSISVYDDVEDSIIPNAFNMLHTIHDTFDMYDETSELSQFNKQAGNTAPTVLSKPLYTVLREALFMAEQSNGAYDPSIGALVTLWAIGSKNPQVPSAAAIRHTLQYGDYKDIIYDDKNLIAKQAMRIEKSDIIIDLGSIAKGYAADFLYSYLQKNGVMNALINLGGNVYAMGHKSSGKLWRVGIQNPYARDNADMPQYFASILLDNETIVSSGIYERYFEENGKRYHHILDTKTGYPVVNNLVSISVVGHNSMRADALATAVYSLGLEKGMNLLKKLNNGVHNNKQMGLIVLDSNNTIYISQNIAQRITRNPALRNWQIQVWV